MTFLHTPRVAATLRGHVLHQKQAPLGRYTQPARDPLLPGWNGVVTAVWQALG